MTLAIALATGAGMGAAAYLAMHVMRATEGFIGGVVKGWYLNIRHRLPPQHQRQIDRELGIANDARLAAPIMPIPAHEPFDLELDLYNRQAERGDVWRRVFTETVARLAAANGGRVEEKDLLSATETAHSAIEIWEQFREYERDRARQRQAFPAAPVTIGSAS